MLNYFYHRFIKPFERKIDTLNRIEISRQAILDNYDFHQKLNPKQTIFPVLKSNAYGHGLLHVAEILKARKPEYLVVDSYYEALELKRVGTFKTLLIGFTKPQNYRYFNFKNIAVTIYDSESIKALGQLNRKIKIHLKIDTGMHRQGILPDELKAYLDLVKKYPKLELEGLLSHLSDADNTDFSYTNKQTDAFIEAIKTTEQAGFKLKYKHLTNSAGSLKLHNHHANAIRLGLGLYGYHTLVPEDKSFADAEKLKPTLELISTIVCTKNLEKGAKVSYNCTYEAKDKLKIGVLPVGYYEGIDRRLSSKGYFSHNNQLLPIIGRVCMNLTCIDLKQLDLKIGDEVKIISKNKEAQNSVQNIANQCETIPYVVTTKLSESIRRVVV